MLRMIGAGKNWCQWAVANIKPLPGEQWGLMDPVWGTRGSKQWAGCLQCCQCLENAITGCWRWRCLCTMWHSWRLSAPGHQCPVSKCDLGVSCWPIRGRLVELLSNQEAAFWVPNVHWWSEHCWHGHHILSLPSSHSIPTHHNSLSSVTTLYCLKRWLCIKDQNWDIEASDFLKSCNFPGTRPECVATSLSWVDHWVGDEDDRLQSALMSSELSDWPGLDKWVPGLECWCPISKVTLNLCKLCNSQSLFHTSTWRHEVQKLRSNLQT